jgi:hypothetical protein
MRAKSGAFAGWSVIMPQREVQNKEHGRYLGLPLMFRSYDPKIDDALLLQLDERLP